MLREGHGLPVRQRNANASWIAFHGERGAVALVSNGLKSVHGPATGVVTFNEAGTPTLAGKGFKMLVEPAAKKACEDQICPYAKCVAGVVDEIVRSVSCAGVNIWEWPTGISLHTEPEEIDAPEARMLSGKFAKCVSAFNSCAQPASCRRSCIIRCQNARDKCVVTTMRSA